MDQHLGNSFVIEAAVCSDIKIQILKRWTRKLTMKMKNMISNIIKMYLCPFNNRF